MPTIVAHTENKYIQDSLIEECLESKNPEKLIEFIQNKGNNEITLSIFDKIYLKSREVYLNLCKKGILIGNPVAHYKYAELLLKSEYNEQNENKSEINHRYRVVKNRVSDRRYDKYFK